MTTTIDLTITAGVTTSFLISTNATTPLPDDCESGHTYGYIALAMLLVSSLIGCLFPFVVGYFLPRYDFTKSLIFKFLLGTSGGFILSVAFVHCFDDGAQSLGNVGWPDYAWGGLFGVIGVLMTWTVEVIMMDYFRNVRKSVVATVDRTQVELKHFSENGDDGESPTVQVEIPLPQHDQLQATLLTAQQSDLHCSLLVLLFGLAFHSIFVGFTIGLTNTATLLIAVLFHQLMEGVALGFHLFRSSLKTPRFIVFSMLIFCLAAPVGCGIAIGVYSTICHDSNAFDIARGILHSLAAGMLVYVACIHMIAEEFQKQEVIESRKTTFVLWFGVIVGSALMSVLGIWA